MHIHSRKWILAASLLGCGALGVALLVPIASGPEAREVRNLSVRVEPAEISAGYATTHAFVGRVESAQAAEPGFELAGLVTRVLVEEGDPVEAGQLLAELDSARLRAERDVLVAARDESRAQESLAALTDRRVQEALALDAVSAQDGDESRQALAARRARTARIEAQIRGIDVALAKSKLHAPFPGRVARRLVDPGNVVTVGQPILRLLETARPEVRVGLSPEAARAVREGQSMRMRVGARDRDAVVRSLLPERSRDTRTVAAILSLATAEDVRDGDLAEVLVEEWHDEGGLWVPVAALSEGGRGLWAVYVAAARDGGHRLERRPVEQVHLDGERAYVRGTVGAGELVVVDGIHRLVPEQLVSIERVAPALASAHGEVAR